MTFTSKGSFTFLLESEDGFGISMRVPEGESLSDMKEHVENFLFACGYEQPSYDETFWG